MGKLDLGSPWISRALPQDFQGYQCGKPGMGADAAPHPLGGKQEANMTVHRANTGQQRGAAPYLQLEHPQWCAKGEGKKKTNTKSRVSPLFSNPGRKNNSGRERRGGRASTKSPEPPMNGRRMFYFFMDAWKVAPKDTHLPDAGLLPVHHRHAAHFVGLDELPLRLVELLRHEAHEGVVGGVSCGHQKRDTARTSWG